MLPFIMELWRLEVKSLCDCILTLHVSFFSQVERIIAAFKLNPYDILDLPISSTESDIKKQYRKKSLLIHPDKFKHDRGVEVRQRTPLVADPSIWHPQEYH